MNDQTDKISRMKVYFILFAGRLGFVLPEGYGHFHNGSHPSMAWNVLQGEVTLKRRECSLLYTRVQESIGLLISHYFLIYIVSNTIKRWLPQWKWGHFLNVAFCF